MEALLRAYSLQDILIFMVLLAIAIKGAISFFDWAKERLGRVYEKEYAETKTQGDLDVKLQQESVAIQKLEKNQAEMMIAMEKLSNKIDALIDSDKDDIKSFLVKEHHYFCYQRGWVDDYSLDCCEKRYKHYVQEGGNSFIEDMMNEIRDLPKQPPQT
jgi:hypothetical protein